MYAGCTVCQYQCYSGKYTDWKAISIKLSPWGLCLRKWLRSSIGCSGGECWLYNSPSGSEEASLGVATGVLLATSVPWARMSSSKCAGSLGQVPTWTPVLQRDAPQIMCQYGPFPIGRAARTPVEGSLVGRRFMQKPSKAKKVSFLATTRHKHYLELHTPSANTWQNQTSCQKSPSIC